MTDEPMTTLCEGPCSEEVPVDEVSCCEFCGLDPLCCECLPPEFHGCQGRPGEPGKLTLERGQRVQDKFQQEKQDVGYLMWVEDDLVAINWRQPSLKAEKIPRAQAESQLENSKLDWNTMIEED